MKELYLQKKKANYMERGRGIWEIKRVTQWGQVLECLLQIFLNL